MTAAKKFETIALGQTPPVVAAKGFQRYIAYLIDALILALLSVAFFPLGAFVEGLGQFQWVPLCLLGLTYFTLFDSRILGGVSPGKRVMKIKLIGQNGRPVSIGVAAFSNCGRSFSLL